MDNKLKSIYNAIKSEEEKVPSSLGLLGGNFGHILFLSYYTNCKKNKGMLLNIEPYLSHSITNINSCSNIQYGTGFAGIGWVINHLSKQNMIDVQIDDFLEDLDEVIAENISPYIKDKNFDFLHGLVGIGQYLLERKKYNSVSIIIEALYKMAVKDEFGIRWISEITGKDGAKQIYDISLSHGSAAIVAFLSNCVKSKYNYPNLTETMLSGSIRYILHQKQENNAALFPGFCSINEKPNTNNFSRLSWCYGDMGIGLAIWQAGEALKDEKLKQEAIEIYLNSTKRRTPEETGDVNVGICHGSAGLAHMYNRMYWNTKMPEFKKAANYWIEETLKLTKFGDSYVEFKSGVEDEWDNDFGFLGGISGIGLALLSHISNEEPTWDKALLMS